MVRLSRLGIRHSPFNLNLKHSITLQMTPIDQFKPQLGQLAASPKIPNFSSKFLIAINPNFSIDYNSWILNVQISLTYSIKQEYLFNFSKFYQTLINFMLAEFHEASYMSDFLSFYVIFCLFKFISMHFTQIKLERGTYFLSRIWNSPISSNS